MFSTKAIILSLGTVAERGSTQFKELIPESEQLPGARAAIIINIHKVSTSCGYAVPLYTFEKERSILTDWLGSREVKDETSEGKSTEGLRGYWARSNTSSIDGIPGLQLGEKLAIELGVEPRAHAVKPAQAMVRAEAGNWAFNMGTGHLVAFLLGLILAALISQVTEQLRERFFTYTAL